MGTKDEYYARGIQIFIGEDQFPDWAPLSDVLQGASELDLLVIRTQPVADLDTYDGDYYVEVGGAEFRFRLQGTAIQTCFGDFGVEWFNDRECVFKILNRNNES